MVCKYITKCTKWDQQILYVAGGETREDFCPHPYESCKLYQDFEKDNPLKRWDKEVIERLTHPDDTMQVSPFGELEALTQEEINKLRGYTWDKSDGT
jgi:hypothetical protein